MDGDPGAEAALDGFSLVLPLPYRVAIILVAGNSRLFPVHTQITEEADLYQAFGRGP